MAVLKANAYGHGALEAAKVLAEDGADMFGVAISDEGAVLREGGIDTPVLVLGPVVGECIRQAVQYQLTMTVCTPESVQEIEKACV